MKINRNSWHYKVRAAHHKYNGWEDIIEPKYDILTRYDYIRDVILALLLFWERGKPEQVEFKEK